MGTRARLNRSRRLWAMLLALSLVFAACTSSDGDEESDEGATEETSGDTAEGAGGGEAADPGVFVHAADDEPLSLDPAQVEPGEGGETMILQAYERLLEIAPDGPDLVPGLATEVPTVDNGLISDDGLTVTFPLREGVTFHDGSDFTADDVMPVAVACAEHGVPLYVHGAMGWRTADLINIAKAGKGQVTYT